VRIVTDPNNRGVEGEGGWRGEGQVFRKTGQVGKKLGIKKWGLEDKIVQKENRKNLY
jgi:hypothetical protein